ncbi:PucR family transcriptional regulator [Nocardia sp. NPDC004604]|uniref:PucR family transcriptional regulator n=1 Tax=Nocardia sp. NPDC004604 TaxID=3157013 RepID=UPI0033A05970
MPFTVADLLEQAQLRLELIAGQDAAHRTIDAAHVTELLRPGSWLQGGELLMTAGLQLSTDETQWRDFVRDVVDGGASALALGLGHGLPYQQAPTALVEAAEAEGIPLLLVPDETPFIAITKAVFAAHAAEERQVLERTLAVQRRLTVAAASGGGLDGLIGVWFQLTSLPAIITDPLGRAIATVGDETDRLMEAARGLIDEIAPHGLRGSSVADIAGRALSVQPVGAGRVRGYALLVEADAREIRLMKSALTSLVTLELEQRYLAGDAERRARAMALDQVLAPSAGASAIRDMFDQLGIRTSSVVGLAIEPPAGRTEELAADLAYALPGGLVRTLGSGVEAIVIDGTDLPLLLRRFAAEQPAGIGDTVAPELAALSVQQARSLLPVSARLGRPATSREGSTSSLLLSIASPDVLTAFAENTLAPIDIADQTGELVTTLRAWLDTNGTWDATAERLGVHRHTVRNRISKIEKLLRRSLEPAATRHELWLALQARDTLAAPVSGARS